MNRLCTLLLFLISLSASAQQWKGTVLDSATRTPLPYATILFDHQQKVVYSDSTGHFTLDKDSLLGSDSIRIEYLGFATRRMDCKSLRKYPDILMVSEKNELPPVSVSNCTKIKKMVINKRPGRIDDYLGPGPETRIIILGRYPGNKNKEGFIRQIQFYAGNFIRQVQVPVRLRWYEWNQQAGIPGRELTASSTIFYLYRKGWNNFTIPDGLVYFPPEGLVLGLEYIYPMEFAREYFSLSTSQQKVSWLSQMDHRWSLGMQYVKDPTQRGFYIINNEKVQEYQSRGLHSYIRPALKFTVYRCIKE